MTTYCISLNFYTTYLVSMIIVSELPPLIAFIRFSIPEMRKGIKLEVHFRIAGNPVPTFQFDIYSNNFNISISPSVLSQVD